MVPRDRSHRRTDRVYRRVGPVRLRVWTNDGLYFDTSKQDDYGFLARLDRAGLQGKRVPLGTKQNITDFALWKFSPEGVARQMEWDSPWGRGFPGWHIECSAMSAKYLGIWFDIHCGGRPHRRASHQRNCTNTSGPRHSSCELLDTRTFLTLNADSKMSKSSGDFVRLQTLRSRNIDPLAYRYLCMTAHYRSKLHFSWASLGAAQTALNRLRHLYSGWSDGGHIDPDFVARFNAELNNDLNLPRALAVLWELVKSELSCDLESDCGQL